MEDDTYYKLCGGTFFTLLLQARKDVYKRQPGWATLSVSISLLGGIQLMGLGIIGEYVGRIFEEVKQRPLYFVREKPNILDINEKNKEKKK